MEKSSEVWAQILLKIHQANGTLELERKLVLNYHPISCACFICRLAEIPDEIRELVCAFNLFNSDKKLIVEKHNVNCRCPLCSKRKVEI
ncbi:MAG: hypothetical protein Harvfovirus1_41 [Harvfovirus sp.]|uniref:Uncharacterized protein n=1 Tax=Harvfovirus sp. TaxID=2487768 RepID=A0A3G4ZZL5_9VIRU|nr:MAG: hypothetical protein Harvfovirus1_41 [Harvfovirus sp.]